MQALEDDGADGTLTSIFDRPSGDQVSRYSPFGKRCGYQVRPIHFLGGHRRGGHPLVGVKQDVVDSTSVLPVGFALNVIAAGFAEHAAEPALADGHGNGLAGARTISIRN